MAARPRLLVSSIAVAAVVSLVGGWALSRTALFADDGIPDDVVLSDPGEYEVPAASPGDSAEGEVLPTVALTTVDGDTLSTAELLGGPVVVNIWYATCPPCERELVDFADVQGDVGDRVRFVGVDPVDTAEAMQDFAADRGVAYELFRDADAAFVDALGVVGFPTTLLVDANGVVLGQYGVLDADELRLHLEHHFGVVA
jgi:thiol-disulfide isomerase/thioredoxin